MTTTHTPAKPPIPPRDPALPPGPSVPKLTLDLDDTKLEETARGSVDSARLVKLPPFWKANPQLWFVQAEAAFQLARVSGDDTMYRYVIINLDQDILPFVSDILESPPDTQKYMTLKNRILASFGETSESKLRRLLRGNEMGNEKPSNFLQRLRNLAGQTGGEPVVRTLFLEQLPEAIRTVLAIGGVDDLATLALQADKAMEVMRPSIAGVHSPETTIVKDRSPMEQQITELRLQIETLAKEVRRSRSSSRSRGNTKRSSSWKRQPERSEHCYYHEKFGANARKCRSPCKWSHPAQQQEN